MQIPVALRLTHARPWCGEGRTTPLLLCLRLLLAGIDLNHRLFSSVRCHSRLDCNARGWELHGDSLLFDSEENCTDYVFIPSVLMVGVIGSD